MALTEPDEFDRVGDVYRWKNTIGSVLEKLKPVYLAWANSVFLSFFSFKGINNLGVFNDAFSSIPTDPPLFS